jgi:hypothetical protein
VFRLLFLNPSGNADSIVPYLILRNPCPILPPLSDPLVQIWVAFKVIKAGNISVPKKNALNQSQFSLQTHDFPKSNCNKTSIIK